MSQRDDAASRAGRALGAASASKAGRAGRGAAKRRGGSEYYRALVRKRWDEYAAAIVADHQAADAACGRDWTLKEGPRSGCACAPCRAARG